MGTFSKAYIKSEKISEVLNELKKYYTIKRIEKLNESKWWYYSENGNETIILSNNYSKYWCELELEFNYSVYFYDEFLRRLSKKTQYNYTVRILSIYNRKW